MSESKPSESKPKLALTSRSRLAAVYAIEAMTVLSAAVLAYLLRFDFHIPALYALNLLIACAVWLPVKLAVFRLLGLDRRWARYVSLADLVQLSLSHLTGSAISAAILLIVDSGVPRSIYFIDFLLCIMISTGLRVTVRLITEASRTSSSAASAKRTIIYGAGSAGASLLRDLRQTSSVNYDVCGFVDDSPHKVGLILHGVRVLGSGEDLPAIVRKHQVEMVLIAIPAATGQQMTGILGYCNEAGVAYKTIPGLAEIIDEDRLAQQIRDVAVEDLLGRSPVNLEHERISSRLRGRTVLVTGAAGSIGSEICRQLARFGPEAIIGFEIAESPLFQLGLEIARDFPGCVLHHEIGSIQNPARLREVFEKYSPSVVYHAAAYKHVPMMEAHIFEAVENNVFGTLNLVEAARRYGVTEFVMISSDKAVRPTNVMGTTKRIAELLVRSLRPADSAYVSVRFGNVLGSNGSVVPIFKDQIARGGPVTVTHPDMRRYFMTIPEACQLVLQASTMGRGSEIFVLNMGEPVRIADLAKNLILLSGLRPDVDIEIRYTGARPGEKLFEELNEEAEDLLATQHEKIQVFAGQDRPWNEIEPLMRDLRECCRSRNSAVAVGIMKELVPEYQPSADLLVKSAAVKAFGEIG